MSLIESKPWPMGESPANQYCDEDQRLRVMASFGLDDLQGDSELTEISRFAAKLCEAPTAYVSLVDKERQRFLAREGSDMEETPRSTSFCAHAMLGKEMMVVPDALEDSTFRDFALVTGPPHIRFYAGMPLISAEGAPLGALCITDSKPRPDGLTDFQTEGLRVLALAVTRRLYAHRQQLAANAALAKSEAKFQQLADSIPDIAWSSAADGDFDYFNQRWFEFSGTSEQPSGGWDAQFHPDDREAWEGKWEESRATGEPYETEFRLRRADGAWRWMLARGVPIRDEEGKVERWFGTLTDIDEARRLSEDRELLAGELAHRIKNIFAVVSGLISLRARGNDALTEFATELNATIHALGRAQGFVHATEGATTDLAGLLDSLMAPYASGEQSPVTIAGDAVRFGTKAATPLALVFHELATNSAKYGALSLADGTVTIALSKGEDAVAISWSETGGPPVAEPKSHGFGSRLVTMAVTNQLGGTLDYEWNLQGLRVNISLPKDRLKA